MGPWHPARRAPWGSGAQFTVLIGIPSPRGTPPKRSAKPLRSR